MLYTVLCVCVVNNLFVYLIGRIFSGRTVCCKMKYEYPKKGRKRNWITILELFVSCRAVLWQEKYSKSFVWFFNVYGVGTKPKRTNNHSLSTWNEALNDKNFFKDYGLWWSVKDVHFSSLIRAALCFKPHELSLLFLYIINEMRHAYLLPPTSILEDRFYTSDNSKLPTRQITKNRHVRYFITMHSYVQYL